ncbi:hypothetical protein NN561_018763 [Cricetulus griseus]
MAPQNDIPNNYLVHRAWRRGSRCWRLPLGHPFPRPPPRNVPPGETLAGNHSPQARYSVAVARALLPAPRSCLRTCKSRALGGRGLEDPLSCSSGSARPPSAIFHPLSAPAPDSRLPGWLLSDLGGAEPLGDQPLREGAEPCLLTSVLAPFPHQAAVLRFGLPVLPTFQSLFAVTATCWVVLERSVDLLIRLTQQLHLASLGPISHFPLSRIGWYIPPRGTVWRKRNTVKLLAMKW